MRGFRTAVGLSALLITASLVGCSSDEEGGAGPSGPGTSAPTATATPTVPSAEPTQIPEQPPVGGIVRGLNPATTEAEGAVASQWFAYREELNRMYREVSVDEATLAALAVGEGYESPVAYVERMKADGTHNEGGSIASINTLTVKGSQAVVEGCLRSSMVEKTAEGVPVETPELWVSVKDTLRLEGPDWRVERHQAVSVGSPCTYR